MKGIAEEKRPVRGSWEGRGAVKDTREACWWREQTSYLSRTTSAGTRQSSNGRLCVPVTGVGAK